MKFDIEKNRPVRNPGMTTSKGSYHGSVFSQTLLRHIGVASSLEADAVRLLDMDPESTWLCEQPGTYKIDHQGKVIKYTPDCVIKRKGKFIFIEVKQSAKVKKEKEKSRLSSIARYFEQHGYGFVVLTEREIRQQTRLNNVKAIARYANGSCNAGTVIRLQDNLQGMFLGTIGNLNALHAANDNLPNGYSIIRAGYGVVDQSKVINDNTVITFRDEQN